MGKRSLIFVGPPLGMCPKCKNCDKNSSTCAKAQPPPSPTPGSCPGHYGISYSDRYRALQGVSFTANCGTCRTQNGVGSCPNRAFGAFNGVCPTHGGVYGAGFNAAFAGQNGLFNGFNGAFAAQNGLFTGLNGICPSQSRLFTGLNGAYGQQNRMCCGMNGACLAQTGISGGLNRACGQQNRVCCGMNGACLAQTGMGGGLNGAYEVLSGGCGGGLNRALAANLRAFGGGLNGIPADQLRALANLNGNMNRYNASSSVPSQIPGIQNGGDCLCCQQYVNSFLNRSVC